MDQNLIDQYCHTYYLTGYNQGKQDTKQTVINMLVGIDFSKYSMIYNKSNLVEYIKKDIIEIINKGI